MSWKISNFMSSTLRQAVTVGATTFYIDADEVDNLPTLDPGDKAKLVIFDGTYVEIVNITDWDTSGELTVERAREDTAARAWDAGTRVIHTLTAEVVQVVLNTSTQTAFIGDTTNVGNLYTLDVGASNPLPALTDGEVVEFFIPATNTDAVTFRVTDGTTTITTKPVVRQDSEAFIAGDFSAGWFASLRFSADEDAWIATTNLGLNQYITQINGGPIPIVNHASNGTFEFARQGTLISTPSNNAETLDGMFVSYDGSIGTFSISRQTFTPGQAAVPYNPEHFLRWDHSAAGSGSSFRRLIDKMYGVGWRAGEQIIASFWAKADSARNVTFEIVQHFGTGGSPSTDVAVDNEVCALTVNWQYFELVVTLPSISTKNIGSNLDDALLARWNMPVNTTMTIDIAQFDVRPGNIAGRFDSGPKKSWREGGTGGSYPDITAFKDALYGSAANRLELEAFFADPISAAELASITGPFGTAAFKNTGVAGDAVPLLNTQVTFSDTLYVNKGAGGATVLFLGTSGAGVAQDAELQLNTAAAQNRRIRFLTGGSIRWWAGVNNAAESGANAGSNFNFQAYDDSGVSLGSALSLSRATMAATFGGAILAPAGSVGAPSISFSGDPDTGIYNGTNSIRFANGGVNYWDINASGNIVNTLANQAGIFVGAGSAGTPRLSFIADSNSGFYRIGEDNLGLTLNGVLQVDFSTARTAFTQVLTGPDGASSTPTYSFTSDPNTGMLSGGVDILSFATGATTRWQILAAASGGDLSTPNSARIRTGDGTVSVPGYTFVSDSNSGWYRIGADNIGLSLNGVLQIDYSTSRVLYSSGLDVQMNVATGPLSTGSIGFRGLPYNTQTSDYTFVLADAGKTVVHNSASPHAFTIPPNSSVAFPIGTVIRIKNLLAGLLDIDRGSGVSLITPTGVDADRSVAQYKSVTLEKRDTNTWDITGAFS